MKHKVFLFYKYHYVFTCVQSVANVCCFLERKVKVDARTSLLKAIVERVILN